MYLCYVDESGHCGKKLDPNQPVEVLCGVMTDATKLFKTQRELAFIVRFLKKRGIPLTELKASEAYRGRGSWNGVTPRIRDRVFGWVLSWARERKCRFIVCPIDSAAFFTRKSNGCEFAKRFCFPYEAGAFNVILAIQRLHRSRGNNKGKTVLIFDEQQGHDGNIINLLEDDLQFTDGYTGFEPKPRRKHPPQRLDQIIDIPHFSKSHLSVLIQIADWAAFVVNRYLNLSVYGFEERYEGELSKIEEWYKFIGQNTVTSTAVDPPGQDSLCFYYRSLRPSGWTAKKWIL